MPRLTTACMPCTTDQLCNTPAHAFDTSTSNRCVTLTAGSGAFCGVSCAGQACPAGSTCRSFDGGAPQCVPSIGECSCRPSFEGALTGCSTTNGFGSCSGVRVCADGGLTACLAPTPRAELCNGQDDDCNGQVDELSTLCNDGRGCTTDSCLGDAGCQSQLVAGSCLIDGGCIDADAGAPLGVCARCEPSASTSAYTPVAGCSISQACFAPGTLNPGNPCQRCEPGTSTSAWSDNLNSCVIGGVCYLANQVNPGLSCERCLPATSRTAFSIAPGTCRIGGTCYSSGQPSPSQPVCQRCSPLDSQTSFTHEPNTTTCGSGDVCRLDSTCQSGICQPGALQTDIYEPNNSPGVATVLPNANECSELIINARLSGTSDADWFRVTFTDTNNGCALNPRLSVNTGGLSARACAYAACTDGTNDSISCQDGSVAVTDLAGSLGCCKTGINPTFDFEHDCSCPGLGCDDDSAFIRVKVDSLAPGNVCAVTTTVIGF